VTDVDVLFAGVAVADFGAAVTWYGRLFGRPPDVHVNQGEVMWQMRDKAWLYAIADPERAGHALVALAVADLDQAVAELRDRGIDVGAIEAVGDAGRKAQVTDADGNTLSYIEVTGAG
jgi:predicted enzyme related to lactoylglutathione lyase